MNNRLIRKTHRYLGLFIGIQFIGWTVSGLYFSWNDLDNVHGDHLRKNPHYLSAEQNLASPSATVNALKSTVKIDSIHSIRLISVLGKPVYQVAYFSGHTGEVHHHLHYALADAATGSVRPPLDQEEATALAKDHVIQSAKVKSVDFLKSTDGHHEYREGVLPAYAISFDDPECTVYISTEMGTFQTIRHDQWRGFDFLWMFHTMDYESRDDFNNWLLRIFSVLGLTTVLSGFLLFVVSSRTVKKIVPVLDRKVR